MKIAIFVPKFSEFTGDARVVELQAEELIKGGNEVTIFAFDGNVKPKNAKLIVMGMPKSLFWQRIYRLFLPLNIYKVALWLPKFKNYDQIIAHLYPMTWFGCLAKKLYGIKYVFWYHGIPDPKLYPSTIERIYIKACILMTKFTVQNVDRAVSVSNAARIEFKKYTGLDSEVIYNKPDLERFYEGIDGSDMRKKHDLGDNPVFLNVGVLSPVKGAHLLIEAFKLIKQKIPNAKLVIVGKHTYDYFSKQLKEKSDSSIIFAGYVPDEELSQYYAMCDIYATCSLWEANNVPVLEVQACGKSVIAFDFEFFKEEVDENGVLVEKENIEKFAEACITKLREVRGDLIE